MKLHSILRADCGGELSILQSLQGYILEKDIEERQNSHTLPSVWHGPQYISYNFKSSLTMGYGREICKLQMENGIKHMCPQLGWLNVSSKLSRSHWMLKYLEGSPLQTFLAVLHNTSWSPILFIDPAPDDRYTIDMLKPQCGKERVCKKQANQVQHHNWHSKPREMPIGRVMVWKFRSGQKGYLVGSHSLITDILVQVQQGLRWICISKSEAFEFSYYAEEIYL